MSQHILLVDLPNHPKGSEITIPDEESSFLIKGKGYYIQLYRDSELLYDKLPDIIFFKFKYTNKEPIANWLSVYKLININSMNSYGEYRNKSLGISTYDDLMCDPTKIVCIDLSEQAALKGGDLIVRIHQDGERVPFIAATSSTRAISYLIALDDNINKNITKYNTYTYNENTYFYYQKMKKEELTEEMENYIKYNFQHLILDKENMRLIEAI